LEGKKSNNNFFLDGGIVMGIVNLFIMLGNMLSTVYVMFRRTSISIFTGILYIDDGHKNYLKSCCCKKIDGA